MQICRGTMNCARLGSQPILPAKRFYPHSAAYGEKYFNSYSISNIQLAPK